MVGGVCAAPAVLAWTEEEEESNPGQVADSLLARGASLLGGFKGLEDGDWDGADPCWWWVLLGVDGKLPGQPKVELAQLVVLWVSGPHGYTYLPDGTKILFQRALLDGYPAG